MPRPNINKPLGVTSAKGPGSQPNATQVTDNSKGWATVANIPVPPKADNRNFRQPLGLSPVLVNGGVVPPKANLELQEFEQGDSATENLDVTSVAESLDSTNQVVGFRASKAATQKLSLEETKLSSGLSFTHQTPVQQYKTVELDWYGAKLSLNCLNAIYQPPSIARGNQGWLLLELPIDPKTGNPPWKPPIAQLGEDGRISVPEFDCILEFQKLRCQILNIEIYDLLNLKYVVVLRVVSGNI